MTERRAVMLILVSDDLSIEHEGPWRHMISGAEAYLSEQTCCEEAPGILVMRVEGLTNEVCDSGIIGLNSMHRWKPGRDLVEEATFPPGRVRVPVGGEQRFSRVAHPFEGRWLQRRPDRKAVRDGVVEYTYDGETVKNNLMMSLEFVIHYSDYRVVAVCGVRRMHTLSRFVRNLRQTDTVPVAMSSYLVLPALQHFIPADSRILVLTNSKSSFEDNYDSIIEPSMNLLRSRIKVLGVEDVLEKDSCKDHASPCCVEKVVDACRELVDRYEGSALQIRAVLCRDYTIFRDAIREGLKKSQVPVFSLADMIRFLGAGICRPAYSWDKSAHLNRGEEDSASTTSSEVTAPAGGTCPEPTPGPDLLAGQEFAGEPAVRGQSRASTTASSAGSSKGSMGIVQVDGAGYWNKLSICGDAADTTSFGYKVVYMRPEGFSFACCQAGPSRKTASSDWSFSEGRIFVPKGSCPEAHLYHASYDSRGAPRSPDEVREDESGTTYIYAGETIHRNIVSAIEQLVDRDVVGISSDCGFMISMNDMVRNIPPVVAARIPIALSSMALLPIIKETISDDARILVLTANGESFDDYYDKIVPGHLEVARSRLKVVGCESVEGFGAEVADAKTVDAEKAAANLVKLVKSVVDECEHSDSTRKIRAVIFECTELCGYAESLHAVLTPRVPIYDAIKLIDFLHNAVA